MPVATTTITPGVAEADKRKSFYDFLINVNAADQGDPVASAEARERLDRVYRATPEHRALGVPSGTQGGYLLPKDVLAEVQAVANEEGIIRPRARVVEMPSMRTRIPALRPGTASYSGGAVLNWSSDGASATETEPVVEGPELSVCELEGYVEISRTLLVKGDPASEQLITLAFGQGVAQLEDAAFLMGLGGARPLGVRYSPALVRTAARGSASAVTGANLRTVWSRLLPSSKRRAVWAISQAVEDEILDSAVTANGPQIVVMTPDGPTPYSILGRPAFVTEKLPATNTLGDVMLIDPSYYVVGDGGSEVLVSPHYLFRSGKVAFRLVHLVAGMPWPSGPATLADGSTTASPFVALEIQ